MQIFALIVVVSIIIGGAAYGFNRFDDNKVVEGVSSESVYEEALTAAKEVADEISNTSTEKVEVYAGISVVKSETKLDLSGRGLTGSLKAEVRQLAALRELDISNNKFTGVPAEVGQLSELRVLNLSNNPITGLPYEIGNLKKLEILDLRGTGYARADLEVIAKQLPTTVKILTD